MAEEANTSPIPLDIIENGTEIQITVNNVLYQRLQSMLFHFFPVKDLEQFSKMIAKINNGEADKDPVTYHLHTILWLCNEFEDGAKKQGKITKKVYDPVSKSIIKDQS